MTLGWCLVVYLIFFAAASEALLYANAEEMEALPRVVFAEGLLKGEVAIVTGGGTGIGRQIALQLAGLGAKVPLQNQK